jgi:hypothetical protein
MIQGAAIAATGWHDTIPSQLLNIALFQVFATARAFAAPMDEQRRKGRSSSLGLHLEDQEILTDPICKALALSFLGTGMSKGPDMLVHAILDMWGLFTSL